VYDSSEPVGAGSANVPSAAVVAVEPPSATVNPPAPPVAQVVTRVKSVSTQTRPLTIAAPPPPPVTPGAPAGSIG
jgi:hypothetical protein